MVRMRPFYERFQRIFSDPQVAILTILLIAGFVGIFLLGKMLAPILASLVIAYLLQGSVSALERRKVPHLLAIGLVFLGFVMFLLVAALGLGPLLWQQVKQLFDQLPAMILWSQQQLLLLSERYPDFISQKQLIGLVNSVRSELIDLGQQILSLSLASMRVLVWVLVYIFLVPLLVFFLLKDKDRLIEWVVRFLPQDRSLATAVWREVDRQIGNYVRGKAWEILILWVASYIVFALLGLQFSMLMSLLVGLSVLVPYVGVTVMAVPVTLVAIFQWGWSSQLGYVVGAYVIIQILDGNVLAPILYSEVVDLHPVAIIAAVLIFGGLFGFWGVFFAIPLATLVQAVLEAFFARTCKQCEEDEPAE
jgi:putative permease